MVNYESLRHPERSEAKVKDLIKGFLNTDTIPISSMKTSSFSTKEKDDRIYATIFIDSMTYRL